MTTEDISRFLPAGLCLAVLLAASLLGTAAAEQSYYSIYSYHVPQNAQEREDLFKVLHSLDNDTIPQATPYAVDPYNALQNPYTFRDPQAELERANTLKAIQKLNGAYFNPLSEDNWNYWAYMWLNGPQA
jgi:hypothetical protein